MYPLVTTEHVVMVTQSQSRDFSKGGQADIMWQHQAGSRSGTEKYDVMTIYCEVMTFFHSVQGYICPCFPLWLGLGYHAMCLTADAN